MDLPLVTVSKFFSHMESRGYIRLVLHEDICNGYITLVMWYKTLHYVVWAAVMGNSFSGRLQYFLKQ